MTYYQPVSYTHLAEDFFRIQRDHLPFLVLADDREEVEQILDVGLALLGVVLAAGGVPVSYTHLDVYKRQPVGWRSSAAALRAARVVQRGRLPSKQEARPKQRRAISAKTDNRPEFQQMIKDSDKKLFDIVLVWKLDRFARNRYDSARYKTQLKKNGDAVLFGIGGAFPDRCV